jgi:hypothetical protein
MVMVQNEIRIRAVPPWQSNHGDEAPFLTLTLGDRAELMHLGEQISFKTRARRSSPPTRMQLFYPYSTKASCRPRGFLIWHRTPSGSKCV